MAKVVLVTVQEREITVVPFQALKDAQDKMLAELMECKDWEQWKEDFEKGEDTGEYYIGETSGYANADDGDLNIDWLIAEVSKDVILVECVEREISITEFNNVADAQQNMLDTFSNLCTQEEIDFQFGDETYEYGINEYQAYLNADDGDTNYDWQVFLLEETNPLTVDDAILIYQKKNVFDEIDEKTFESENFRSALQEKLDEIFEDDVTLEDDEISELVHNILRFEQYGDTSDADDMAHMQEDLSKRFYSE